MNSPAGKPAAYADLEALPPNQVGEIVAGELFASPRPVPRHAGAATGLAGSLWGPFQTGGNGPGGWRIVVEPELHLSTDILVTDLAGWRRERLPELPDTAWFDLAPDWVCEVLSPSTRGLDRIRKLPIYAREQVGHAWLVDPDQRSIEVFRQGPDGWILARTCEGDGRVRLGPFEAVELDLLLVWGGVREQE